MRKKLFATLVLLVSTISLSNQPKILPKISEPRVELKFEIKKNKIDLSLWAYIGDNPLMAHEFTYENGDFHILYGNIIRARSFGSDYICNVNHLHLIYYDRNNFSDSFLVQLQPSYRYYELP